MVKLIVCVLMMWAWCKYLIQKDILMQLISTNFLYAVMKSVHTVLFDSFFVKTVLEIVRFETCCEQLSLLPDTFSRDAEQQNFQKVWKLLQCMQFSTLKHVKTSTLLPFAGSGCDSCFQNKNNQNCQNSHHRYYIHIATRSRSNCHHTLISPPELLVQYQEC